MRSKSTDEVTWSTFQISKDEFIDITTQGCTDPKPACQTYGFWQENYIERQMNMIVQFNRLCGGVLVMAIVFIFNTSAAATISLDIFPENISSKENPVGISFNGKIYSEALWFDEVQSNAISVEPDEAFVVKAFFTNQRGSANEILALWSFEEQAETKDIFSNPVFMTGSQGYLRKIRDAAFLAKVAYGPYIIFFIQYTSQEFGDEIDEYVITKIRGNYYMTNKLKEDPLFVYLDQKLKMQLSLKQRK